MIRLQRYNFLLTYTNFSAAKCVFAHLRTLFTESGGESIDYYIVGLDNESIGILMQQELRTLWNRKQKIKDRINENDLDGWIEKEVIETVIRRQMEEK